MNAFRILKNNSKPQLCAGMKQQDSALTLAAESELSSQSMRLQKKSEISNNIERDTCVIDIDFTNIENLEPLISESTEIDSTTSKYSQQLGNFDSTFDQGARQVSVPQSPTSKPVPTSTNKLLEISNYYVEYARRQQDSEIAISLYTYAINICLYPTTKAIHAFEYTHGDPKNVYKYNHDSNMFYGLNQLPEISPVTPSAALFIERASIKLFKLEDFNSTIQDCDLVLESKGVCAYFEVVIVQEADILMLVAARWFRGVSRIKNCDFLGAERDFKWIMEWFCGACSESVLVPMGNLQHDFYVSRTGVKHMLDTVYRFQEQSRLLVFYKSIVKKLLDSDVPQFTSTNYFTLLASDPDDDYDSESEDLEMNYLTRQTCLCIHNLITGIIEYFSQTVVDFTDPGSSQTISQLCNILRLSPDCTNPSSAILFRLLDGYAKLGQWISLETVHFLIPVFEAVTSNDNICIDVDVMRRVICTAVEAGSFDLSGLICNLFRDSGYVDDMFSQCAYGNDYTTWSKIFQEFIEILRRELVRVENEYCGIRVLPKNVHQVLQVFAGLFRAVDSVGKQRFGSVCGLMGVIEPRVLYLMARWLQVSRGNFDGNHVIELVCTCIVGIFEVEALAVNLRKDVDVVEFVKGLLEDLEWIEEVDVGVGDENGGQSALEMLVWRALECVAAGNA